MRWTHACCATFFADVLARHKGRAKFNAQAINEQRQWLLALMTKRRQPVSMQVADKQSLEHANERPAKSIRSVLKLLERQLAENDCDVDDRGADADPGRQT